MIMCVLNLLDLATTLYITSHGGIELNPLMAFLISHDLFLWVKLVVGSGCCIWLEWQSKYHQSAKTGKIIVCIYYMLIAINNFWTIGVINK